MIIRLATIAIFIEVIGVQASFRLKVLRTESERSQDIKRAIEKSKEGFLSKAEFLKPSDYYDVEYIAIVYVGSNRTPLRVILDTGSADFWVPDISCGQCDYYCHGLHPESCVKLCDEGCCSIYNNFNQSKCDNKNFFDAKTSTTYREYNRIFRFKYGSGDAFGFYGSDILELAGMRIRVTFGQVTETYSLIKYDSNFDGILGLGFQSLSLDKTVPPFLRAFQQGLVPNAIFTVFLKRGGFRKIQNGGEFTFGEFDERNCDLSDLKYVSLTCAAYFQFQLDGFSFGNYESNLQYDAISDTGTSFIKAPLFVVQNVAASISATEYPGGYQVPCMARNEYPEMRFWIGGYMYSVSSDNYILQTGPSLCELGMSVMEGVSIGPKWVLGDVFIREYCNVYDLENQRIGFAKARY